jgi:hypothetical protein
MRVAKNEELHHEGHEEHEGGGAWRFLIETMPMG